MSDNQELLPCPYCGGEVEWCGELDNTELHDCHIITCPSCEYSFDLHNDQCHYASTVESAKIEVIKAWNTRHIPDDMALVPREPSQVMINAGYPELYFGCGYDGCGECVDSTYPIDVYKAMIQAWEKENE